MVGGLYKYICIWWICKVWKLHKWTSAAIRGEKIVINGNYGDQMLVESFLKHCKMTCERCNHESEFSIEFKTKIKKHYAAIWN